MTGRNSRHKLRIAIHFYNFEENDVIIKLANKPSRCLVEIRYSVQASFTFGHSMPVMYSV